MHRAVICLIACALHGQTVTSVFDPLTIARFQGAGQTIQALTTDFAGSIYVAGTTTCYPAGKTCFLPVTTFANTDVFVAKLDSKGKPAWVVYAGGSGKETASVIALDAGGNVYVAGTTESPDFPATHPRYGPAGPSAGFLVKYGPGGDLKYSVMFGGVSNGVTAAIPQAMAIDPSGNAYVVGKAASPDFPVTEGAWNRQFGCPWVLSDCYSPAGFIAKFGPDASLVYASFASDPAGVLVNSKGEATIAGAGTVPGLPAPATNNPGYVDFGYVLRLDATGSNLLAATYLGGPARGLARDAQENLYISGISYTPGFPVTPGAYVSPLHGQSCSFGGGIGPPSISRGDVYLTKLRSGDWQKLYGVLLGGSCGSSAGPLVVDVAGRAAVAVNAAQNFPLVHPLISATVTTTTPLVAKLSADGSALLYSTYLDGQFTPPVALAPDGALLTATSGGNSGNVVRLPPDDTSAPANLVIVASAANFERGLPPPGSLAAIFCTGLNVSAGITSAVGSPLPLNLAGVAVTIGGIPAPIFAVANSGGHQQINVQVPSEAASADVLIQAPGQAYSFSEGFRLSPGDFFTNADGTGIFQHASDYSLVSPEHPAQTGEAIVAYLTGVAASGLVLTNTPAPFSPLARVPQYSTAAGASTYSILVGNTTVTPDYFGLAPGLIGVFQLNFIVPAMLEPPLQKVSLIHYTCSGNFHGTCGFNNGYPATASSSAVTIPIQ